MFYENYEDFEKSLEEFVNQKQYKEALDLLLDSYKYISMENYQKNIFGILNYATYIARLCKKHDIALELFKKMLNLNIIVSTYSLDDLSKIYDMSDLIAKNNELIRIADSNGKYKYKVFLPDNYDKNKKYPLIFNFHGDGNTLETHRQGWKEEITTSREFITVYIQSSHVCDQGYYFCSGDDSPYRVFDDFYDGMVNIFNELCQDYPIDKEKVLLGGFSGGACAAVDLSLADVIPVRGVIALCPYMTDKFTDDNILKAINKGIKWTLIEGEISPDEAKPIHDRISAIDKDSSVYILCHNLDHWFPDNFDDIINDSIKYILDK